MAKNGQFSDELCKCCDDKPSCCAACCCMPIVLGQLFERTMVKGSCIFVVFLFFILEYYAGEANFASMIAMSDANQDAYVETLGTAIEKDSPHTGTIYAGLESYLMGYNKTRDGPPQTCFDGDMVCIKVVTRDEDGNPETWDEIDQLDADGEKTGLKQPVYYLRDGPVPQSTQIGKNYPTLRNYDDNAPQDGPMIDPYATQWDVTKAMMYEYKGPGEAGAFLTMMISLALLVIRRTIRKRENIPESGCCCGKCTSCKGPCCCCPEGCQDCCEAYWCPCCLAAQLLRHFGLKGDKYSLFSRTGDPFDSEPMPGTEIKVVSSDA